MEQYYKITGLTVKMDSYGRTIQQAEPYRCAPVETPDIVIRSNWETAKAKRPDYYGSLSDSDGEYIFTGSSFYKQLLNFGGFMLHSSAVVVDGKAYLFSATSGTGKSTHTKLWLDLFGDQAYILNDDKPALRLEDGTWYAYGTPWSGKHDISVDARIPLGGIAMIHRGEENTIRPFTGKEAILELIRQVNRPKDMHFRIRLLELLDQLFAMVPIWYLECNMKPEAAIMSYEAMSGKQFKEI